jgi:hypothetical protein
MSPFSSVHARSSLLHLYSFLEPLPPSTMKSTKVPKRPTLRWDKYRRQVLCCLYRFFDCNKKQTEEIFSYMFRGHLNDRGIHGFVPFATLHTQWVWMKTRGDPVWSHVHVRTAFDTDGEWKEIIARIKSAAKTLRFELREKTEDDINISRSSSAGADDEQSSALVSRCWAYLICNCKLTIHSLRMDPCQCFRIRSLLQRLSARSCWYPR